MTCDLSCLYPFWASGQPKLSKPSELQNVKLWQDVYVMFGFQYTFIGSGCSDLLAIQNQGCSRPVQGFLYGENGKENGNYYCILEGYIGIMEKKMEPTVVYWGVYWDNGKENATYCCIFWGYIGIMEKKMETIIVYSGGILG